MQRIHFELPCGAAGDMLLGALIDCGADYNYIVSTLQELNIADWKIEEHTVLRSGITAKKIHITDNTVLLNKHDHAQQHNQAHQHDHAHTHDHNPSHTHTEGHAHNHTHNNTEHSHQHGHRHLSEMLKVLEHPKISPEVRKNATAIFNLLASAEGAIHNQPKEKVHFHEISGIDTLIDVIGTALALENLNVSHISATPVAVGSGTIKCAHGIMPVPAPATLQIIQEKAIPIYSGSVATELLTPTGAAILGIYCNEYTAFTGGTIDAVGYGAGDKDFKNTANTVRAILYTAPAESQSEPTDKVLELRFTVDDATSEEIGLLQENLYLNGALESYTVPATMKKSRPACEVTILLKAENLAAIKDIIFKSGITLGMRIKETERYILQRTIQEVTILKHTIPVKFGFYQNHIVSIKAEYEDCKDAARATGKTFKEIKLLAESKAIEQI